MIYIAGLRVAGLNGTGKHFEACIAYSRDSGSATPAEDGRSSPCLSALK
jgi:hypothetical protein